MIRRLSRSKVDRTRPRALMQCFDVGAERFWLEPAQSKPRVPCGTGIGVSASVCLESVSDLHGPRSGPHHPPGGLYGPCSDGRTRDGARRADGRRDHGRRRIGDSCRSGARRGRRVEPATRARCGRFQTVPASVCNAVAKGCQDIRERILPPLLPQRKARSKA